MNPLPYLLFLITGTALLADPSPSPQPKTTDLLAETLPILQAKYIDFKELGYQQDDRLNDLIARSNGKITLYASGSDTAPMPILTATLPENILYWRLASFTPKTNWSDFGSEFRGTLTQGVAGVVLDLRNNIAPDDFAGAARLLGFLEPQDSSLANFLSGPLSFVSEHPFRSPVIVLVNNQTSGAAEALAACLKTDGALVLGRPTAGKAAVFEEQKLSSGQILRFVAQPVDLPHGTPLWGHPVSPDISLTVRDEAEKAALALIDQNQVTDVIGEADGRHRMSEAALVRGDDPEWDAYVATLEKNSDAGRLKLPSVRDTVLISALDSLKAIQVSRRPALSSGQLNASIQSSSPNP